MREEDERVGREGGMRECIEKVCSCVRDTWRRCIRRRQKRMTHALTHHCFLEPPSR